MNYYFLFIPKIKYIVNFLMIITTYTFYSLKEDPLTREIIAEIHVALTHRYFHTSHDGLQPTQSSHQTEIEFPKKH